MSQSGPKYVFGPFQMDPGECLLQRGSEPIPLTAKAFDVLVVLLENHSHLVEKNELLQRVWGDAFVEESVLSVNVAAIRRALVDNGHQYIETVPKRGYRFAAPVQVVSSAETETPPAVNELMSLAPAPPRNRHLWRWAGTALACLLLLAIGVPLAGRLFRPHIGNSVAVLPLQSLSSDPEQQNFADAMTDLLLTDLGRIPQLRVVSRQSVLQYAGTRAKLPDIARELNVDAIVEGTVRREGGRVRITAQLIQASTDRHLWAQSYERDVRDSMALQQEVAESIAREIGVQLAPASQKREGPPVPPAAHEAFLRGMSSMEAGNNRAAMQAFREAIAIDPNYAPAYTKISGAYFGGGFFGFLPPDKAFPAMKEAALKAIEIDDSDAEAHANLASEKLHYEWDWQGAEREFRRSLQLNPSDADVRHIYAHYLLTVGRPQESLAEMDRAFQTDPVGLDTAT
jgi:TolB-like protein/DNA-binding winged helix-turn-helix (wHTH) protein